MFKIEYFVDDKNLVEVMKRVSGLVKNLQVVPVIEAGSESSQERIIRELRKKFPDGFKKVMARQIVADAGMSPNSTGHYVRQALKAGLIKPTGNKVKPTYVWVK